MRNDEEAPIAFSGAGERESVAKMQMLGMVSAAARPCNAVFEGVR